MKILFSFALIAILGLGCTKTQVQENGTPSPSPVAHASAAPTAPPVDPALAKIPNSKDLKIEEIQVGTGREATSGKTVAIHYTARLPDGKQVDTTTTLGQPQKFKLGAGQVIWGWERGIMGMKMGGKRKLTIPPELAYGSVGVPPSIPPNATLIYEIELVSVE